LPDDDKRLRDEEIKGEEEYNAELRRKQGNVEDSPFDFIDNNLGFDSQDQYSKSDLDLDQQNGLNDFNDLRQSVLVGFRKNNNVKYEDF
jgi:hypothetical protein